MQKTVVLSVVGLTNSLIGKNTPFLAKWAAAAQNTVIRPVLPAVTCTAQSTYLTGKWPEEHGIVANGWYFREEDEIKLWRQSNKLVQAPKIWEVAKAQEPNFTVANMGWWYNMNTTADYTLTPRPQYLADGRKLPDCYTQPAELRDQLQEELGTFPLFNYWGPKTSIKSSKWIADASKITDDLYDPTLTLIYLPHLDYNLQRLGPGDPRIARDLQEIDAVCADLIQYYEAKGAQVVVLSEYGISDVNNPVHINRVLRENGYIAVRHERGTELLDMAMSKAFAVADHQIAHVYIENPAHIAEVQQLLQQVPGVQEVLAGEERNKYRLAHERCGELVVVADERSWFTYYFWLDDKKAPDYARMVDIHKKPGYDPVEMFADPKIKFLIPKVAAKVLKKKLGFRMVMDIIPLDATLIKGSHGRIPEDKNEWPVLLTKNQQKLPQEVQAVDVFNVILSHLQVSKKEMAL
ncbi:putative AlkP superfamily pyrophosphatase or phosphodiesterase [Pontibacter ummariensis]|uniref:Predicted pyrophosphatase or phosphodiesterase, AlkP superfamily n=1 Tax=Pontibacter ummariensis TaxID=1610492 RepID=A0A239IQT5_9BACT|nr:nucleotide pyrophosphatase/phosphodiesterase family protein [Pontibacter ummariensis]PRY09690.1 putative AlkP superfamily pyrophosphatase or phosphodiesterase [Pontibacter ummariensis]SNS95929.1 Predicted pyrophosphatase or phosphodiesterase, AlkP superfamily [Pontibacter ummariensis]